MAAPWYNVFLGTETGLLKGIDVTNSQWNNLNSLENADRQKEICALSWGNPEETEVCLGLRNRHILVYHTLSKQFHDLGTFDGGSGKFCSIAKFQNSFVTAVESGLVKLWTKDPDNAVEIEAGKDLCCMIPNPEKMNVIATGGKENDLKLWDLESSLEPLFKAKNVRNDWLNLRVPVWITGVQFLPGCGKVVTSTGHHQVRVYDTKSSMRRPVIDVEVDEYPLTAISLRNDTENQVIVGNTQGKMALVDLRQGKVVQVYKGFAGGVRDIKCHLSKPLVASCGLDRHVRVHDITTKELVHKFYVKSRLNCLLFSSKETEGSGADEHLKTKEDVSQDESGIDSDEEDVWKNLEEIKPKNIKKRKTTQLTQEKSNSSLKRKKLRKKSSSKKMKNG